MTMHEASRTLVKSTPELWAECSDGESLSRHLGAFGEIRITKLEPETAVAWEGEDVRGTVTLEPSGWGTRVVLTATADEAAGAAIPEAAEAAEAPAPPEPEAADEPAEAVVAVEPDPQPEPEPVEPEPAAEPEPDPARPGFFARLFGFRRRSRPDADPPGEEDPRIDGVSGGEPPTGPADTEGAAPESPAPEDPAPEDPAPEDPAPEDPAMAVPEDPAPEPARMPELEALVGALDSLGTAHRRPFSRS